MQNKDILGYYTAGDYKTYSKLDAIEHSSSLNPVRWHFNEDVFNTVNWTVEPPGSLDFWYGQRAAQLREKYDYIVLWYSGGADSYNMLQSFVRNNIFIDEIAQWHNLEGEQGNKLSAQNSEVFATSAPKTKELIDTNPVYKHTKHRMVDVTQYQKNILTTGDIKWDYWYQQPDFSPNTYTAMSTPEIIPEWRDLILQGKKVCFILGIDKPQVKQDSNGSFWAQFTDSLQWNGVGSEGLSWYLEPFYWSRDLPELPIKQAHCVMRYLQNCTDVDADGYHLYCGEMTADEYGRPVFGGKVHSGDWETRANVRKNNKVYHLMAHGMHRLLYADWDTRTISCPKSFSKVYSIRDTWFLDKDAPDLGQRYYIQGLLHVRNKIKKINPDMWWEYKYDPKIAPYHGGIKPLYNTYRLN